jgi:hypothetical protein
MYVERLKRVEPMQINYYPLVIDYDFVRLRPRGGSASIDFFSSGRLFSIIDELDKSNIVYIQKSDIAPESGFFLMDFAEAKKNPKKFIDTLKGMNMSVIYIEDSKHFPPEKILAETDFNIKLVNFVE